MQKVIFKIPSKCAKKRKMYAGIDGISHSGKTEVWFEFRPGITLSQNIEKGATQLLVSQHFNFKTIFKYFPETYLPRDLP